MEPTRALAVDEIDLSDSEFWKRPLEEREGAFATPNLEITGEPDRLVSNFIHGIKHMPCTFTPSATR